MRCKRHLRQVIIGNSAAGLAAATAIRRQDPSSLLTIISEEDCPAYSRVLTTYYLKGKIERGQLQYRDLSFYGQRNIQPFLGHRALAIDVSRQRVLLDRGGPIPYDNLLIATGASPTFPPIPGIDHQGVFGLRTIADAQAIDSFCGKVREVVILGAGLVSLQVADALLPRNLKITVVVKSPQVLSQVLDPEGAALIEKAMEQKGVRVLKGLDVQELCCDSKGSVCEVLLDDGQTLTAQMVVVGKGVRPNIHLLEETGIEIRNGILVDERMRTNIHHIYAAGDVAEGFDFLTQERRVSAIWPTAAAQGEIAGFNMAGLLACFDGFISRNVTHLFGQPMAALGLARARGDAFEVYAYAAPEAGVYRRLVLREGQLVGASLISRIEDAGTLYSLIQTRRVLGSLKEHALRFPLSWGRVLTGR
ncbi:MAG: FAD-dependent oxidoreductase [bacterium]